MSRVRLIHPGATKDEALCRCSVQARLAWAYLPCYADREGRLADKPVTLRFEIFPADLGVDMEALLDELAAAGLIVRYLADGRRYIQIRTFARHQKPHRREAPSFIPPPADPGQAQDRPGTDLGQAKADLFPAGRAVTDPDPVSDPVGDPEDPHPERADPPGDPRARAIPDLVSDAWPDDEPEPLRVHQGAVRVLPGAVARPGRDPPGLRAQRLLDLFGRVRSEVAQARGQPVLPWHPAGRRAFDKAVAFIGQVEGDRDAQLDVEPTMRLHLGKAFDSQDPRDRDVGFSFGAYLHRFTDLREEIHGMKRAGPLAGLTDRERKNIAATQLWLAQTEGRCDR
jgi:hypothetical protein